MLHAPSHPGALLAEELEALDIRVSKAARDLGVSRQILSAIVNCRRPVTAEMAVRIGKYIGNGSGLWLRMQANHDLWNAELKMKSEVRKIRPPAA